MATATQTTKKAALSKKEKAELASLREELDKKLNKKEERFNPFSGDKSSAQLKIEGRIAMLTEKRKKEGLTPHEARMLQTAKWKIDSRSASKLYKEAKDLPKADLDEMLGKAKFPSFKNFTENLPNKALYSMWDAFGVLTKLNKAQAQRARASKQQKKENAK